MYRLFARKIAEFFRNLAGKSGGGRAAGTDRPRQKAAKITHFLKKRRIYFLHDTFQEGGGAMPSGGARKGAGRKPKPLAEKLAAGNPGRRPLKKVDFGGGNSSRPKMPEYLRYMEKPALNFVSLEEIFEKTLDHLEPSGCLNLIPVENICDYVMAKYYLIDAQYALSKTAIVGYNEKHELTVTSFTEAMLKLQKNVALTWGVIWDVVSRSSETLVKNPEEDLIASIMSGRVRKKRPKGEPDDGRDESAQNSDSETESGEVQSPEGFTTRRPRI